MLWRRRRRAKRASNPTPGPSPVGYDRRGEQETEGEGRQVVGVVLMRFNLDLLKRIFGEVD